jgi:hypothetical protein
MYSPIPALPDLELLDIQEDIPPRNPVRYGKRSEPSKRSLSERAF